MGFNSAFKGLIPLPRTCKYRARCLEGICSKCHIFIYFQGYFGCAVGKAKQAAKTEIEKLKLADMTCKELVKEAARM